MAKTRDIVVIGAGANGLVAAFYLAKAGLKPLVVERRPMAGGAAITEEILPGFKCPTLAHSVSPLLPEISRDMRLERQGLEWLRPDVSVFAPSPDGRALVLSRDPAQSTRAIAQFSKKDAERFIEFHHILSRGAAALQPLMSEPPPSIDKPTAGDLWTLLKAGRRIRGLGKKDMLRLLRWGPMAVADLLAEWFESDLLRATIAGRGIFGTFFGPWSAGSGAVLLLRATGDPHPTSTPVFSRGGMGALTQAMAKAAVQAGAEIRTGAEVAKIHVRDGSATEVVLSDGEELAARAVVSSADPRRTFLRFIDPIHLTPDFLLKMQNYRCLGTVAKVNLALSDLPSFAALKPSDGPRHTALAGRIHIGPEIDYLERAFDDAKYGALSRRPYLEIAIPSIIDPTLAPPGRHVMSVCAQFAPFKLKCGDWNAQRDALGDVVVKTLSEYASDLPGLILHRQVITPLDLEQTYALTGGHIFHGELALGQLYTMRPLLSWAQYRTPLVGLYLCGSGAHPGTGLTGASGYNAARKILNDRKKNKW